jgi:hypothetical protein
MAISGLALVVSIVSAVIGQIQEKKQLRISVREQLSSVVQDLISSQAEYAMLYPEPPEKRDSAYGVKMGTLNHKLTSLARQACALDKLDGEVGFDVQFIAIANALATSGDQPTAEEYFEKAVARSPSVYYRSINLTLFGTFLFNQSQPEKGRRIFADAAAALPLASDFNRMTVSRAYQAWCIAEAWNDPASGVRADECYQNAQRILQGIKSDPMRKACLRDLEQATGRMPAGEPQPPS